MKLNKMYFNPRIFLILGPWIVLGCANQRPPSGGPVDNIPPAIIKVEPQLGSTRVNLKTSITIDFSEGIDKRSLTEALFISPLPTEKAVISWRGNRLNISLPKGLVPNQTYIISLGTGIRDRRQNRMKETFSLAFSTGDQLDRGEISGIVANPEGNVVGTQVWIYDLRKDRPDPDPANQSPKYVIQCNQQGSYRFNYLSNGHYRLFAILDDNKSNKYEIAQDAIGIPSRDIFLTDSSSEVKDVNFQLAKSDTTAPRLIQAIPVDQRHIDLKFSESIDFPRDLNLSNFQVRSEERSLPVVFGYPDFLDPSRIHLVTDPQRSGSDYTITVENITDVNENPILTERNKFSFPGSAVLDTIRPRIIKTVPKDSAKQVMVNEKIQIFFSKSMDTLSVQNHFHFEMAGQKVNGHPRWINPSVFEFLPEKFLTGGISYRLSVIPDSIYDSYGIPLNERKPIKTFTTITPDTLGTILGILYDPSVKTRMAYYLKAEPFRGKGRSFETTINSPGPFIFDGILPGAYRISAFQDRDGNGKYSNGSVIPFNPSERFVVMGDSVRVRAQWETDGIEVIFKNE